jgi:hypothetical protein
MQVHSLFLLVALLTIPFCTSADCSTKSPFVGETGSEKYKLKIYDADHTWAYNKVASCATLTTKENEMCCYLKIKFDNNQYDETFTQKGCYVVKTDNYLNEDFDFDELIDGIEGNITAANKDYQVEADSVSIDCSSQFLQFVGLSLLLLLL